jgi:uncharacterized membrane protein (DUF106 family)
MARTESKVRDLVAEDGEMVDALEFLLERDGPVEWRDVDDELTSGQWGRLIERGVLEDTEEGFRLTDSEGVEEALYGSEDEDDEGPPTDTSWSQWDKAAGLLALTLFPGYWFESIRNPIGSAMNTIFGPIDSVLPFYAVVLVLAVLTGLYSSVLQGALIDSDTIAYYQNRMKEFQDRQQAAKERGDEEELEAIREEQVEQMSENLGMFKMQLRPMAWVMLLTIPVFLWLYWRIGFRGGATHGSPVGSVVMPMVGQTEWQGAIFGFMPVWIVWYFLCSMGFSQIIRKALDVQPTASG